MDFLNAIGEKITSQIDLIMVALVFCGGYFQGVWLKGWKASPAFKTFLVSTGMAVAYVAAVYGSGQFDKATMPVKWVFSYCLATSIYELGAKRVFDWLDGFLAKLSKDKDQPPKTE